jgi:nucleotidyltransferase substrate binding protein (TIGR01987 family)
MERLIIKFKNLQQALDTFGTVVKKFDAITAQHEYYEEVRDSIIQRFEYSIDAFWKILKEYLEFNNLETSGSPKSIMRLAFAAKLITSHECDLFIDMLEDRNSTSHAYNVNIAEEISHKASDYYFLMASVTKKIQQNFHESVKMRKNTGPE